MDFKPACSMELDITATRLLYNIIKSVHEKWPPDDTDSKEAKLLADMKTQLYGCIMEYLYREH